jgi:hypothetical protein
MAKKLSAGDLVWFYLATEVNNEVVIGAVNNGVVLREVTDDEMDYWHAARGESVPLDHPAYLVGFVETLQPYTIVSGIHVIVSVTGQAASDDLGPLLNPPVINPWNV